MSRVFLAEEMRLSRQVVIKVLPPEMGAGVNAERFEREIRLAARLQHPHIVPLLTAGASGDLLYYIMPFIAGESLRTRLARENELPVPEAVRILREVIDALAYAHRNGVVHRDIKPENVLMSEGHAVVTDFGVAKAVSASSGGSSLTSLGVALGTPAYMAPEQAAADPHVDHRADIYAAGVVGYEMLAGRPPFAAPTPQAMLAAHLTQSPEPVMQHRGAVAPALSSAIMRCLEKRPADRWQSAAELSSFLETVTVTSAGHGPTGAQEAISSGTEAAIRRAHPVRVAALFAGASAVVLLAVYQLILRLGLPDWVLYGAVLLLLIGLPITVAAGIHERRRAQARTTGHSTVTPVGLAPWVSWRRALLGGGLAFVALGVFAAGYMAMRLLGIGPVGTLVASGVLENREQLILADFENRSSDSTLGQSLTEAFRVDLSQSPTLRLVDPSAVTEALARMQRPAESALTAALAREVAERQGVKAIVSGQIDPVGKGYVLSASLLGSADGRIFTAVRESADDETGLLSAIDRLSKKLRERIGESLTTIRANPKLEDVTTPSLDALRKYTEALRMEEDDKNEQAVPLLLEAVALDSNFAMAWRKLAVQYGNTFTSPTKEVMAATKAYELRDRLPPVERNLAIAYYHAFVDYEPAKVIAAYRTILSTDPDNEVSLNNLSIALTDQRKYAEAESLADRASRLSRGTSFFLNTLHAQVAQGKMVEAQATLDRYRRGAPGSPFPEGLQAEFDAVQQNYTAAERSLSPIQEKNRDRPFVQFITTMARFGVAEIQGKVAESRRVLRAHMQYALQDSIPRDYIFFAMFLAQSEVRYSGDKAAAAKTIAEAIARYPLESFDPLDRPYALIIQTLVMAGQPDQARRLLRDYHAAVPEGVRRGQPSSWSASAVVAEADKQYEKAMETYRIFYLQFGTCGHCGAYELGTLFDRAGQADSAIAAYERVADHRTLYASRFVDRYALAPSLKRLGELYETKGDRKRAAAYYNRFVELWKNADPELQPAVRDVRARLAQLAREPSG